MRFQGGGIMTLHEKIDYLLKKRNMNRKQLSKESGIPYTTIMNMYNRDPGNMNLSTFKKLCQFFEVSMDSMAYDELDIQPYDPERIHTTKREREIIMKYRQADVIDQTSVCRTLEIDDRRKKEGTLGA